MRKNELAQKSHKSHEEEGELRPEFIKARKTGYIRFLNYSISKVKL